MEVLNPIQDQPKFGGKPSIHLRRLVFASKIRKSFLYVFRPFAARFLCEVHEAEHAMRCPRGSGLIPSLDLSL